jgi:hypothetical protein
LGIDADEGIHLIHDVFHLGSTPLDDLDDLDDLARLGATL